VVRLTASRFANFHRWLLHTGARACKAVGEATLDYGVRAAAVALHYDRMARFGIMFALVVLLMYAATMFVFRAASLELHAIFVWWSIPISIFAPLLFALTALAFLAAVRIGRNLPGLEMLFIISTALHLVILLVVLPFISQWTMLVESHMQQPTMLPVLWQLESAPADLNDARTFALQECVKIVSRLSSAHDSLT